MSTTKPKSPVDEDTVNIITGIALDREHVRLKSSNTKIIKSESIHRDDRVQIVGGDGREACGAAGTPAIIIEKKGDRISKIIVRCPCGRHSELLCEYEEEGETPHEDETPHA